VLFAGFAVAQVIALLGGGGHVLETAGLTYAEYARSGFFQLLWVAGLTVAGLLVLRAATAAPDRRFTVLSEVVVALTLVIVVVAVRRLGLYKDAYGLTMLRLYSSVFAVWIGSVLVLVGLAFAGVGRGRVWWPAAAGAIALTVLFVLNVMNPEAVVVRHNLDRVAAAVPVDTHYLHSLSDDALPTLESLLPALSPAAQAAALAEVDCPTEDEFDGWAAWNLGRSRADAVRERLCAA
jgi:hypothetical protein